MDPKQLLEERGIGLHIGGTVAKDGWGVLNAQPGDHVDFVGDLRKLPRHTLMRDMRAREFTEASYEMVYASHVLEHVAFKELPAVLKEVYRILKPDGRFFISVPDMDMLCRLFLSAGNTQSKTVITQMMFGAQTDEYDFHYVGLFEEALAQHLARAGFREVFRVPTFGIFDDTSNMKVGGHLISLNVVAIR